MGTGRATTAGCLKRLGCRSEHFTSHTRTCFNLLMPYRVRPFINCETKVKQNPEAAHQARSQQEQELSPHGHPGASSLQGTYPARENTPGSHPSPSRSEVMRTRRFSRRAVQSGRRATSRGGRRTAGCCAHRRTRYYKRAATFIWRIFT